MLCKNCKCDSFYTEDHVSCSIRINPDVILAPASNRMLHIKCRKCGSEFTAELSKKGKLSKLTPIPTQEEIKSHQHLYTKVMDVIDEEISKAVAADNCELLVQYATYEIDEDNVPIYNLHEIPQKGKVILFRVCVLANRMIVQCGDRHHVFLEGISLNKAETKKRKDKVKIYDFAMGS